ncbi:hypothetical protein H5410_049243 [Solanum commersonii]|uniref:Uncharacterized protein n=1 Tax=Solanum commersonii TaxID=4109 RepID=A0A9J5XKK2_SOLCO|nr:hypothetical protein H5410_049243 [Solanum commersonii]
MNVPEDDQYKEFKEYTLWKQIRDKASTSGTSGAGVNITVPRETMQNSILEGYEIQPKTIVHVNFWAIARDPEI